MNTAGTAGRLPEEDGRVPDRWLVLTVECPEDPEVVGLIVEELLSVPVRGVEETPEGLVVHHPEPREGTLAPLLEDLRARLSPILGHPPTIRHRWQPHEEWRESWRRGLGVRRITPRIVVSPSWLEPELAPGEVLVTVDPGMAFGTAEHPTTRGAIRLLDRLLEPGTRVADVGAGSGILSIAAARLGAGEVEAWEMDGWSCETARENLELNGVADVVSVVHGAVDASTFDDAAPFDGIVANIEGQVLLPLLPSFHRALARDGWLILSGILDGEIAEVRDRAGSVGFEGVGEDQEAGWWTGAFRARDVIGHRVRGGASA